MISKKSVFLCIFAAQRWEKFTTESTKKHEGIKNNFLSVFHRYKSAANIFSSEWENVQGEIKYRMVVIASFRFLETKQSFTGIGANVRDCFTPLRFIRNDILFF